MKEITVSAGGRTHTILLNNAENSDQLTPKMATAAKHIAIGAGPVAYVSDRKKCYRCSALDRHSPRLLEEGL